MSLRTKNKISTVLKYVVLIVVGFFMIYPLLWMIGATFKDNNEIFSSVGILADHPTLDGYRKAMQTSGGSINIWKALINTYSYVIPKVIFTVVSATITAFGFARFDFKGKKVLFAILMSTLFLPQVVLNIPQFVLFTKLHWVNSSLYLPIIIPSLFAVDTFFVYMLIQFLRGVPVELEEAAKIDGCNIIQTLIKVVIPMIKPAIVSCGLFQFMWGSNDFMGPLLYVSDPAKYPASLFVKISMDPDTGFSWNKVLAVSLISIIPSLIVFFLAQDSFIDGIAAGGVKG